MVEKEAEDENVLRLRGSARQYLLGATALIGASAGQPSAESAVEVLEAASTNLNEAIVCTKQILLLQQQAE
jgi:hypothetical protein